jgi:hypothetical protein
MRLPNRRITMADEADLAFDSEQRHLSLALAAQRRRRGALQPMGCCHNCGNSDGIQERLFCDGDCAADWEYQDTLRRRLGLPAAAAPFAAPAAARYAAA